jgi:hypothetical protein
MKSDGSAGARRDSTDRAARTQEQLKALAWLLDSSIRLPGGFRIGLDPLLGLVPFVGDAAGVLLSAYIVSQAARLGAPRAVVLRMMLNVAVEGVVGLIPFAGDVFDAVWKANQRNVQLLEGHLANPVATARSSRRLVAALLILIVLFMALMSVLSMLFLGWLWDAVRA